jgi:hypothetical protein
MAQHDHSKLQKPPSMPISLRRCGGCRDERAAAGANCGRRDTRHAVRSRRAKARRFCLVSAVRPCARYTHAMAPKTAGMKPPTQAKRKTARTKAPSGAPRKPSRTKARRAETTRKRAGAKKKTARVAKRATGSKSGVVITKISRHYLSPFGRSEVGVPLIRLAVRTVASPSHTGGKVGKAI